MYGMTLDRVSFFVCYLASMPFFDSLSTDRYWAAFCIFLQICLSYWLLISGSLITYAVYPIGHSGFLILVSASFKVRLASDPTVLPAICNRFFNCIII